MLSSFARLGLPLDATDQVIRQQYLEQVREFNPEKDPEAFREITAAYEAIKDRRSRVRARILVGTTGRSTADILIELIQAVRFRKQKTGLQELMAALHNG